MYPKTHLLGKGSQSKPNDQTVLPQLNVCNSNLPNVKYATSNLDIQYRRRKGACDADERIRRSLGNGAINLILANGVDPLVVAFHTRRVTHICRGGFAKANS